MYFALCANACPLSLLKGKKRKEKKRVLLPCVLRKAIVGYMETYYLEHIIMCVANILERCNWE